MRFRCMVPRHTREVPNVYYHSNGNNGYDEQKTLVIASLFRDDFCIDWLVDLLTDLKPSQILSQLEQGVTD